MILYSCTLPFPPSVNSLFGGGSGQQRFPSKRYKDWLAICQKLRELNIEEEVSVEYIFTWPDNRVRDGQNFQKAVLDYLVNEKVLKDDNWKIVAKELWRHRGVNKESHGVEVVIRSIQPHTPSIQPQET